MKFARGVSEITHMFVEQALRLSSEFSVNSLLAIAGSVWEY